MGSEKNSKKYIGKYEIIEEIGKGGMGVVYKSIDPYIERTLAIKTIRFDLPKDEADQKKWRKRFLREAKLAGNLAHPNIVTIYDAGEDSGLFYIAMEYIEGNSLRDLLKSSKKVSFEEVQSLMEQICDALSYASKKGVIHCDIKPENIIIDKEGKVYLVDFGIARTSSADLTKTMLSMVTPSYTSPERLNGIEPDIRSDIFALGAVLYEIVSGQKAFQGDTISTIMKSILYDAPVKIEQASADMPNEIHYIISRALAKEPEDRYQNYEEFISDLKDYKNLKPDESFEADYNPDDMTVLLTKKKNSKSHKLVVISLCILAAIALAGISFIYMTRNASQRAGGDAGQGAKYIEEQNFNKAIDNLEKVLASNPNDFNAYYLLGVAYHQKGLLDEAIEHYKKAIDINRSFAPSYIGIAELYEQKGDINQAIAYYEQYVQLFPQGENSTEINQKLSDLKGMTQPGEGDELAALPPSSSSSEKSGEIAAAAATAKDEPDQEKTLQDLYEKGKTHLGNQEYAEAILSFKEYLKTKPDNTDVQRYLKLATHEKKKLEDIDMNRSLGIKAYENKNYVQSAIYFKEILNLDPENKDAKKYLVLIRLGAMEAKIDDITRPDAIQERPFYKRTVKVLGLNAKQQKAFEKIYSSTGKTLTQRLQEVTDEQGKIEALTLFAKQTYTQLREILKADQLVTLDNLIAARKGRKKPLTNLDEESKETTGEAVSGVPAVTADETAGAGPPADLEAGIKKNIAPETDTRDTAAGKVEGELSTVNDRVDESISMGIKAYTNKDYDQATVSFNKALELDPSNMEAKKYLEYIKLAKIKRMNDEATGSTDTETKETDDAKLPEGM